MTSATEHAPNTLNWLPVGLAAGLFLAITFAACVLFDLVWPAAAMHSMWMPLLPGFAWITWGNFILGLIETLAYGFWIALLFCPLYNYFAAKFS